MFPDADELTMNVSTNEIKNKRSPKCEMNRNSQKINDKEETDK
jgi:hypothetical protein